MTRNPDTGKRTLLSSILSIPAFSSHGNKNSTVEPSFMTVMDLVNSGVMVIGTKNLEFVWFNKAFGYMTGFRPEDLIGSSLFDIIPKDVTPILRKNLEVFIGSGRQQAQEYVILSSKGDRIYVNVKSTLQKLKGKDVIVVSLNDNTHQRKVNTELQNSAFETTALINSIDSYLWSMDNNLIFQTINTSARDMFRRSFKMDAIPGESFRKAIERLPEISKKTWEERLVRLFETGVAERFELAEVMNGQYEHIRVKLQPIIGKDGQVEAVSCHVDNDTDDFLRHTLLKVLNEFKTKIIGVDDLEELLWLVTDHILAKLDFEDAIILMVEDNLLMAKAAHGEKRVGQEMEVTPLRLKIGEGVTGSVVQKGKSEVIQDTRLDTRYLSRHFDALSEIAVPIKIEEKTVGVINCESKYPGFFTQAHLEILEEVADLVASKMKIIESDNGLKEMQMLNKAVLDSTPNSFLLLSPENKIRSFNQTAKLVFEELFGTDLQPGDDFWKFVPPEFVHEYEELFGLAFKGDIQKAEKSMEHKEFGTLSFAITFAPASLYGQIFGITVIIENITEKKQSADLIVRKNEELLKANQELDKFVYSVSHDLRSPIANVMGLTTIIDASDKLEEVREYSTMIESTMKRMDNFIHNILDYSRNSRLAVKYENFNLYNLVEDLILDYYHIDGMKSIKFLNKIQEDFEFISDSQRIRIILGNLLSNAIKYHDKEKSNPKIEIFGSRSEATVEIRVKDNGQGIEKNHLPQLFQMFYTANLRAEGSGIGLYILKDAVGLLGGEVDVESEPGLGTEFIITLPVRSEITQNTDEEGTSD